MSKTKLALVGLTAVTATSLAACGGGGSSSGSGGAGGGAETKSMTFVSFGGAYQDAQKGAFTDPYGKQAGITFKQDGPTDYAKLKAMVESGNVTWDVVDADPFFPIGNCGKYAEKLDYTVIDKSKVDPAYVSDCAIADMQYGYVLFYNTKKFGSNPPKNWADFFDTTKFPGKRAIQNAAQGGGYEVALLADGVSADKLYPIDYARAEKKLNTIKGDLVMWDTGAQSQEMMEKQQVDMILAWNGRAYNAAKNGAPYVPVWNQYVKVYDVLMVPKGAKNKAAAMKFINYAISAEPQTKLTETIPYASINSDSKPKPSALIQKYLPTKEQQDMGFVQDQAWWAKNQDAATEKWTAFTQG